MKAGKGIVHNETIHSDCKTNGSHASVIQFWINLPSKQKFDNPEYLAIHKDDIPKQTLNENAGWVKILAGKHEDLHAKIPCYSKQFLYHIHLEA